MPVTRADKARRRYADLGADRDADDLSDLDGRLAALQLERPSADGSVFRLLVRERQLTPARQRNPDQMPRRVFETFFPEAPTAPQVAAAVADAEARARRAGRKLDRAGPELQRLDLRPSAAMAFARAAFLDRGLTLPAFAAVELALPRK